MAQRNRRYHEQRQPITRAEAARKMAELDAQRQKIVDRMRQSAPTFYTPQAEGSFVLKTQRTDIPLVELWAEVHWTEAAAEMIRADEYRYISPEFDLAYVSPSTGDNIGAALLAIGLTNRPFLKGMAKVEDPDVDNVSRIQVFATGEWQHPWYGTITVEPFHLQEMIDNREAVGDTMHPDSDHEPTEMMVDYNHMSLFGGPDESKAAGWVRGAGLYQVRPEKDSRQAASEPAGTTHPEHTSPRSMVMKEARVREILGLPADTAVTTEHLNQALDKIDVQPAAEPAPVAATEPAGPVTLSETEVVSLREQAAQGAEAAKQLKERDARDAVTAALAAKKVTPAMADWAKGYALADPPGFAAFVAAQPVLVDTGRAGSSEPAGPDGGADAGQVKAFIAEQTKGGKTLVEAQALARKQFGEEAYDAYRFPNKPKE